MNVTGSCHCGEIQFEATIDPKRVGICHCTDCQIFRVLLFELPRWSWESSFIWSAVNPRPT